MNSNATTSASVITGSADYGPALSIISWLLLVISTLLTIARLATKWAVVKRLTPDDALAIVSLIFNIAAGLVVAVAAINGLGKSLDTLSDSQLSAYEKSSYAGGLLYIATLCFTKLSIIMLFWSITPVIVYRRVEWGLGILVSIWGAICILAASFPCQTPHAWSFTGQTCYNRSAFWRAFGTIEILVHLILILLPFHIVKDLQMSWAKKSILLGCFSPRFLDIAAIATQIAYANGFDTGDQTLDVWPWFLIGQIIQTLSIFTSCIPYLRPFFEALNSGLFMSDELRRRGVSTTDPISVERGSYKRFIFRKPPHGPKHITFASLKSMAGRTKVKPVEPGDMVDPSAQVKMRIGTHEGSDKVIDDSWDTASHGSRSRIIKATTTVKTRFEDTEGLGESSRGGI